MEPDSTCTQQDGQVQRAICPLCNRSYGRNAHLRRHMQSHGIGLSHPCSQCPKKFSRLDSLRRHEINCHATVGTSPTRKVDRGFRACLHCAAGRAKCSRGMPCTRCSAKNIICTYPSVQQDPMLSFSDSATHLHPYSSFTWNNQQNRNSGPRNHLSFSAQETDSSPNQSVSEVHVSDEGLLDSTHLSHCQVQHNNRIAPQVHEDSSASTFMNEDCTERRLQNPDQVLSAEQNHSSSTAGVRETQYRAAELTEFCENGTRDDMDESSFQLSHEEHTTQTPSTGLLNINSGSPSVIHRDAPPNWSMMLNNALESNSSSAKSYACGAGARDTRFNKLPNLSLEFSTAESSHTITNLNTFAFPAIRLSSTHVENLSGQNSVPEEAYSRLCDLFRTLCLDEIVIFERFTSSNFVSHDLVNLCVAQYFENFHLNNPFLQKSNFLRDLEDPTLLLAVMGMGAFFVDCASKIEFLAALQEFLRRSVFLRAEKVRRYTGTEPLLAFIQASLLSVIGMYQSRHPDLVARAAGAFNALINLALENGIFRENSQSSPLASPDIARTEHDWKIWQLAEQSRRTAYSIYLFDMMSAVLEQRTPTLRTQDIELQLPFPNDLYETQSHVEWSKLIASVKVPPHFLACLERMQKGTFPDHGYGEFAHLAIVYGLFSQTQQIEASIRLELLMRRANNLTQTAKKKKNAVVHYHDLLSSSLYVEWRNRMCDCIDMLHTHANSVTGLAYGFEQPVVLHLHLSRLLLLTPYQDILQIVSFLLPKDCQKFPNYGGGHHTAANYANSLKTVRRWLEQDGYKMRLAVVHAAGLFWHVRRYSVQSFSEPMALLLAALLIWTYCLRTEFLKPLIFDPLVQSEAAVVTPKIHPDEDASLLCSPDTEEVLPVLIDRVLDDELVQTIVHGQQPLRMYMNRVGDLSSPNAPGKVLQEAARLLQLRCWAWPTSKIYFECLTQLAKPSQQLDQHSEPALPSGA